MQRPFTYRSIQQSYRILLSYELLEIPRELVITLHIDPLEQDEAFDLVKTKLAFMEQQKVDEQKKALQNGYDFEMLSYDLSYSLTEAKGLVDDLQNKGQKLYSMSSTIHFHADTVEKLTEIHDEVNSIGRQFGFKIIELEFMQEAGLNATLPLGIESNSFRPDNVDCEYRDLYSIHDFRFDPRKWEILWGQCDL